MVRCVLGLAPSGGADIGEVLAAVGEVKPKDASAWRSAWQTLGYAAVIRRIREFALTDAEAASIDTPLLITSPEGEQFWPGQSERLAALTTTVSHLVRFTAAEGADGHCEPLARTLVHERVLDWISETIPG